MSNPDFLFIYSFFFSRHCSCLSQVRLFHLFPFLVYSLSFKTLLFVEQHLFKGIVEKKKRVENEVLEERDAMGGGMSEREKDEDAARREAIDSCISPSR